MSDRINRSAHGAAHVAQFPAQPEAADAVFQPRPRRRRDIDVDESDDEALHDQESPASSAAPDAVAAGSTSTLYIGGALLGAIGIAAAAGGGGGSGPIVQVEPDPPKPKPEEDRPEPDPMPDPKPEPKPEPQPEPQPEPKPEPQPEPQPEPKPEPKPEPEPQPEPKPEPKPEPEPEPKPEPQPKPEPEPEPKPEPNRPAAPTLSLRNDTGAPIDADPEQRSTRDGRTRDATVLVDGIAAGAIWQYSRDGIDWIEGSGNRHIDASFFGSNDGAKSVHVRQVDSAGLHSAIQTLSFVLDRTAPAVTPLTLLDGDGTASSDRLSNNLGLRVGAEAGNFWSYFFDTGHGGQGVGAGTTDPSLRVPDGLRTLTVKQYDGAGNYSEATTSFWLDRTPPTTPMAQLDQDTGISASDRHTQNGSLTVSGLEIASVWKYRIDGGAWIARVADSRTATIPSSAFGADGQKRVEIMQTDPAGNDSGLRVFEFDLDRIALPPMLYLRNDTGLSGDLITSDPTVVLGAVEGGARWQWRSSVFQAWEDTSSTMFNTGVTSGRSMVQVRQIDAAGNVSEARVLSSWIVPAGSEPKQPLLTAKGEDALLVGTLGADVFKWQPKTVVHTGVDRVLNYRVDQGDVIDLTGILDMSSGPPLAERLVKIYGMSDQTVILNVLHATGQHDTVDYAIQLWNTLLTDPIAVRVGSETFMV